MKYICMASAAVVNVFTDFKSTAHTISCWFNNHLSKIFFVLLAILAVIVGSRVSVTSFLEVQALAEVPVDQAAVETYEEPIDPIKIEAEYVAKVLYGTAQLNSVHGQKMAVWCIINRVEHPNYPDSIKDVCQQKDQWMGYSDTNPIMQDLYDLSYEILSNWHNGGYRDISPDFIFMKWSPDQICLKTEFEETKSCRFIYE